MTLPLDQYPELAAAWNRGPLTLDGAKRCRAKGNHMLPANDDAEDFPRTFRDIENEANADARAIVRGEQR